MTPDHARLLGYLIGDGYVGGKTPVNFINVEDELHQDVASIAATLGCYAKPQSALSVALTHRKGEKNGVLELCRAAGIYGRLAWEKQVPAWVLAADTSAEVVGNLLFGLFETDGHVSVEQTGAIRVGFTTTSEQLAHQIHWLLVRFGIGSTVGSYDPTQKRPSVIKGRRVQSRRQVWEVRVSGSDNVAASPRQFRRGVPAVGLWLLRWRPTTDAGVDLKAGYLAREVIDPILSHLERRGVTRTMQPRWSVRTAGDPRGGMKQVLGATRLRRIESRLSPMRSTMSSCTDCWPSRSSFSAIREVLPVRRCRTFDARGGGTAHLGGRRCRGAQLQPALQTSRVRHHLRPGNQP
ncbi:MAG: LAGLIDADG family homing endonuclease [Geodermatophilaceae bacterium]